MHCMSEEALDKRKNSHFVTKFDRARHQPNTKTCFGKRRDQDETDDIRNFHASILSY